MDRVKTRVSGVGLALVLVVAVMLAFATAAQAQTPAEDQYGSPTGSSMTGSAGGGADATATTDGVDPGSGGNVVSSTSTGQSSEEAAAITGGVLPSTGGAPIYLLLAGTILLGTGATLWMRFRAEA